MNLKRRICPMCKEERWIFDSENLCMYCAKEQREKRWDEICKDEIANGATEFTGEDTIRCPWCGERQDFECCDDVLYSETSYIQCQSCHQKFTVKVETFYTYDTTRGWGEEEED